MRAGQQRFLRHIFIRFNINNHVTYLCGSLQILCGNVDALLGKNLVQRGQYARTVFVNVHQTTTAV